MTRIRFYFGWALLAVAAIFWAASYLFSPYAYWLDGLHLRPQVPVQLLSWALASVLLAILAGGIAHTRETDWHKGGTIAFAALLLFVAATSTARAVWLQFWVLS